MKIKIILGLIITTFLASSAGGPQKKDVNNGYMWENFETTGKNESWAYQLGIVKGYLLGCRMVHQICADNQDTLVTDTEFAQYIAYVICEVSKLAELSYGDYIDGINQFYSDYANKNLPIDYAFRYIKYRTSGVVEDTLKEYLETWRKRYSE